MKQDLANVWHARFHFKEQSLHDLLADAEMGEDIVQDRVTCDVGSRDFADGCDSTTQVGREQVCGKAIRQPCTHGP